MSTRWIAATLVHNTPDLAARMREQLPDVLVIDNGSTVPIEGAAMRFEENLGFVRGWNEAMRRIVADMLHIDYVWMLNSDLEGITAEMGEALCSVADEVAASVITPAFNSPHDVFHQDKTNTDLLRSVDWVDWCCPMVNADTWRVVGEFDTQGTGYFADVDWCNRCLVTRHSYAGFWVHDGFNVNHLGSVTAQRIGHTWSADDTWLCKKWGVKSWTELT